MLNLAILVGCSTYDDPAIADLVYAANDADGLVSVLTASCGVDPGWMRVLSTGNIPPSRNNIIRHLAEPRRIENIPPVDNLFFVFSGHGYRSPIENRDYLLPQDAVFGSLEDTAIEFSNAVSYLQSWRARRTILFLDLCRSQLRSGKALGITVDEEEVKARELEGFVTFWSCSKGQRSFESESLKNGLFSYCVKRALGPDGQRKTVAELDEYLRREVPILCKKEGFPEQTPSCFIEPLAVKDAFLVSLDVRRQWESSFPIGRELRTARVLKASTLRPSKPLYCGFDFGTSHSAICLADEQGKPLFIPSTNGRAFIPSAVAFTPDWNYLIGSAALEYGRINSSRLVRNIKRKLGTVGGIQIGERSLAPEFLASLIIRSLAMNFEEYLGEPMYKAVVSVPANFTLPQCNALLKAFELAGVSVMRLVGEPSAAALVMQGRLLQIRDEELVFIFDLGGGTFDVAIVEIAEGVWAVIAAGGDRELGGMDYDEAVFRYVKSEVERRIRDLRLKLGEPEISQIWTEAERAKIELGTQEQTTVLVQGLEAGANGFMDIPIPISRSLFRDLTKDLERRADECITSALSRSSRSGRDITSIVIAGQGAKLFTIRELIAKRFPGVPVRDAFQESAVAVGMGLYTDIFKGKLHDALLLDSIPVEIGFRYAHKADLTRDGPEIEISTDPDENTVTGIAIPRDTTIPTKRRITARLKRATRHLPQLDFVEIGYDRSTAQTVIGSVPLDRLGENPSLVLDFDVDANRTIFVRLSGDSGSISVQLNNFFPGTDESVVRIAEPGREYFTTKGQYEMLTLHRSDPFPAAVPTKAPKKGAAN